MSVKKPLKYLLYVLQDFIDLARGIRTEYPPRRLNFVGSGEFKKIGDEFIKHFVEIGHLKTSDSVLDIGCGIGRMAIPLTKYLKQGSYSGFDIDRRGIDWCKKNITPKFPNFAFEYADIFNKYYNKKGKISASRFKFPYKNNSFDFIFATSVFTHMLPDQVGQYLSEAARVLKPTGSCFFTFFSIDEKTKHNIAAKKSHCNFIYKSDKENYYYSHKDVPEAEIGYETQWIRDQLQKFHLDNKIAVYPGCWSGEKGLSYQDIYICKKII